MTTTHPIHWLYQQFVGDIPVGEARCYLCGIPCQSVASVAKGVPDTFNSHYLARCPSSGVLCAACAWYLDNTLDHPAFRKMSLIVARDSWHNWQRETMKTDIGLWVSQGIQCDAYCVVSLSKKKHILLQAPMNAQGTRLLAIQIEEQVAYVDQTTWQIMNRSFMTLLALGHTKSEILSGGLYAQTLRKHGQINEAMQHNTMLAPYRHSPQLELLSYVTLVEKEETHESTSPGDGMDSSGVAAAESRVDANRPGVQSEIPHGHLAASRKQRGGSRPDEQHVEQISQQSLF